VRGAGGAAARGAVPRPRGAPPPGPCAVPGARAPGAVLRTLPALLFLAIVGAVLVAVLRVHDRPPAPIDEVLPTVATGGEDGAFPRVVTLWDGTAFTLPAPPRRIVPAGANLLESVVALVGIDAVAGAPAQAADYARLADVDDETWAALPRFSRYTAEPILALGPDLVLVSPWQAIETTEILIDAGVPVVTLPDAASWDDQLALLARLGELLGAEARATALVRDLERRRAALAATHGRRDHLRAMTYTNFGTGGWTAGSGTHPDTMLRLAGLQNASALAGRQGHTPIDFEQILALDPGLIVVGGEPTARLLREEPSLAELRAVREDRVVVLDPALMAAASHHLLDAAEALAREVDALGV